MKIIALEEHVRVAAIEEAVRRYVPPDQYELAYDMSEGAKTKLTSQLQDLGSGRLKQMDATGIDV
jgi:hypothetical protein